MLFSKGKFVFKHDHRELTIIFFYRLAPQYRINWRMKARTAMELQQRCNTLLTLVEREYVENQNNDKQRKPEASTVTVRASNVNANAADVDKFACKGILTVVGQQKAAKRKADANM